MDCTKIMHEHLPIKGLHATSISFFSFSIKKNHKLNHLDPHDQYSVIITWYVVDSSHELTTACLRGLCTQLVQCYYLLQQISTTPV